MTTCAAPQATLVCEKEAQQSDGFDTLAGRFREYMKQRKEGISRPPAPDPAYICRVCRDTGFVHPRNERGRIDFSRVIPCPGPGCAGHRAEQARLDDGVAMGRGVHRPEQTFDTFERLEGNKDAFKYARRLGAGTSSFIWLLIYGGTGNGKSHLCNAMAKTAIRRSVDTRLVAVADLFSALRAAIDMRDGETVMQRYKETGFLILDDYGLQYGTEWEAARFDELMSFRYANLLPTAMTTNLDLESLPPRIRSRFEDHRLARIAHNTAKDYRFASGTFCQTNARTGGW